MSTYRTTEEIEQDLGAQFRALRLEIDLDQVTVAERAVVSLSALRSLEAGRGTSLRTMARVARALGRERWLLEFHQQPAVSPIALARAREGLHLPQRASCRRGSADRA